MQYMMQDRVTHTGAVTFQTPHIDISESPLLTINVIVYSISGAVAKVQATLETSDDLETWAKAAVTVTNAAVGSVLGAADPKTEAYGKYGRIQVSIVGTNPVATYSVALNTFPSS